MLVGFFIEKFQLNLGGTGLKTRVVGWCRIPS